MPLSDPEALKSFAALDLLPQSINPTLHAREVIVVRAPCCKFRIGVTDNPDIQERTERNEGSIAFEVICQADNLTEAEQVRNEVERYFLRHYQGRTLSRMNKAGEERRTGSYVYVTCFMPNSSSLIESDATL